MVELFKASDLVFTGVLASTQVDLDTNGMPWTLYTFDDVEVVAGEYPGSEFGLRCPGGVSGGLVTKVQATPDFTVGERSLIFFEEAGWCQVTGWFQGEFKVVPASDGSDDLQIVNRGGQPAVSLGASGFVWGDEQVWSPKQTELGAPRSLFDRGLRASSGPSPVAPWRLLKDELVLFSKSNPKTTPRTSAVVSQVTIAGEPLGGDSAAPVGR
jgi:hypothetical protein